MGNVFFRTIILYFVVVFSLRLMGKREIGELSPSELVVAIMISEVASISLQSTDIPLLFGIIPVLTLVSLEMMIAFISLKSCRFRKVLSGSPFLLVRNGIIDQYALKKLRLTIDDLFEQLRLKGISRLEDVAYAFLETNGQLSVLSTAASSPVSAEDAGITVEEVSIPILLVKDGVLIEHALTACGLDHHWLDQILEKEDCKNISDVFLLRFMPDGTASLIKKQKSAKGFGGIWL